LLSATLVKVSATLFQSTRHSIWHSSALRKRLIADRRPVMNVKVRSRTAGGVVTLIANPLICVHGQPVYHRVYYSPVFTKKKKRYPLHCTNLRWFSLMIMTASVCSLQFGNS
jgi:hypothetical protein